MHNSSPAELCSLSAVSACQQVAIYLCTTSEKCHRNLGAQVAERIQAEGQEAEAGINGMEIHFRKVL